MQPESQNSGTSELKQFRRASNLSLELTVFLDATVLDFVAVFFVHNVEIFFSQDGHSVAVKKR